MNRPCASRTDASLLYWFENRPATINPPTSTDGCLVIFRFHIYSTNPTSQRCGFGSDTTSTAGGGRNDTEGGVFLRLISKVWSESLLYLFCWITLICCRFYLLQMSGMQSKTNSYDGGEAWSQLTSLSCGGYDLRMHARWHVFFFPPPFCLHSNKFNRVHYFLAVFTPSVRISHRRRSVADYSTWFSCLDR